MDNGEFKADIRDFVGVFDNALPETVCEELIDHFHYVNEYALVEDGNSVSGEKRVFNRQQAENGIQKTYKDDSTYWMHEERLPDLRVTNSMLIGVVNSAIRRCIDEYHAKYDVLRPRGYGVWGYRLQHTNIGGGYHVWHEERSAKEDMERLLAIIIYLNDVDEGGETEFLYYPRRVAPKKGRILLFPAGFTHTHRGNPPISNEKYIIATWVTMT